MNRVPRCPLTRIYEEIDLLSHEKHQAYRLSSIQEAVGLLFSYCTGMKITSEAKLPIYQKSSVAHRIMWHLRLLHQLKCLTALKNLQQVSELYRYDALNLLSYMTLDVKNIHSVVHHKVKLLRY